VVAVASEPRASARAAVDCAARMEPKGTNADLHCFRCGYSLGGLNGDALCPECGFAVALSHSPAGRVRSVVPDIATARLRLLGMLACDWSSFLTMMLGLAASIFQIRGPIEPLFFIVAYLVCNLLCALVSLHFAASIRALGVADPSLGRARAVFALVCCLRLLIILVAGAIWMAAENERFRPVVAVVLFTGPVEWTARIWMLRSIRRLDSVDGWAESREGFEAFFLFGFIWCALSGVLLFTPMLNSSGGFVALIWAMCLLVMAVLVLNLTIRTRQFLGRLSASTEVSGTANEEGASRRSTKQDAG
jgi:hypothetical protein